MKAAVLTQFNTPLEIADVPVGEPGPGQVRIDVRASGVCYTDLHAWHGVLPITPPIVLGHEPVGTIAKVGAGVTHLNVGDRVGVSWHQGGCGRCVYCERHQEKYCAEPVSWMQLGGGHAQSMIAEASGCTALPDGLAWETAAPLFCAGYTVMSGYRNASPRPGERVAVVGIGGLGHIALQIAKAMGHEVIAVTGSADKAKEVAEFGADEVLVVRENAGRELMEIGGADVVLSTTNSMKHASEMVDGLLPEGRLVVMGVGQDAIQTSPASLLFKQLVVKGSTQNNRSDLVEVLQLAAEGKVKPKLELYKLDEINGVFDRLSEGRVRYRAVVVHEE
ncbi:MAG: alcohol dehydrogenase catalytic domain-containing protein [bacterium]